MPLARTSAKPAPRENASPYKSRYNLRNAKASSDVPESIDNNYASTNRAAATNPGPPRAKVPRERCTKEQTAALEEFYNLHGGSPTPEQMEGLATRIHKSYNSTNVWFQNRRATRGKATARRQTAVHATVDPVTDNTQSSDTIMLEDPTPERPGQPTQAMAAPLPQAQKAKKSRGRAAKLRKAKAAISGPTHAKKARTTASFVMPTRFSSPGINITTDSFLIPNDRQASGNSNGSISQPPESTPPAVAQTIAVVPRLPINPEQTLEQFPLREQEVARMMTEMAVMTENPGIVAGEILSDSLEIYEAWPFSLPSASNRRMTRSRSQKIDVSQWRQNGEEKVYRVVPHTVPESWMAGPSKSGKLRNP